MSFNDKLVFFRTRYGLSKNELGERMGLATKIISDWEKGKSLPKDEEYGKLSQIFGIKKEFFVEESLNYKDIENFNREDYWGIELNRPDCDRYIEKSKKASKYLALGLSLVLLIPILVIFISKFLPILSPQVLTKKTLFIYKLVSSLVLLLLGFLFIHLGNGQRKKYNFVDNGMMYYLKKDNRIYMENVLDQERPKARQKILIGVLFIVLAIIIAFNFGKVFGGFKESLRLIVVILIFVLINVGLNFIINYALRFSNIKKLLKNQNSYSFDDKNL